jgi:hypothetical protein
VLAERPSKFVANLVGSQYYWIRHHAPLSILGYIAVLECHPTPVADLRWIARTARVPERALTTLDHHARVDGDHSSELFLALQSLDLAEEEEAVVRCVALEAISMLREIFEEATDRFARGEHV